MRPIGQRVDRPQQLRQRSTHQLENRGSESDTPHDRPRSCSRRPLDQVQYRSRCRLRKMPVRTARNANRSPSFDSRTTSVAQYLTAPFRPSERGSSGSGIRRRGEKSAARCSLEFSAAIVHQLDSERTASVRGRIRLDYRSVRGVDRWWR